MNKIEYKAEFLYQEFRGENIAEIIELLKYDAEQVTKIEITYVDGLYIFTIGFNNETDIFGRLTATTTLTEGDILAYDNGCYKKVSKEEIEKIRKAELNNGI